MHESTALSSVGASSPILPPPGGRVVRRVVVAMSGGVDSSVTAALLREAGYEVVGITLRLASDPAADETRGQNAGGRQRGCCAPDDLDDARHVGDHLDIPVYVSNHRERFAREVIRYFVDEYRAGRTPNPCVMCNESIKYDALLDRALSLDADALATGHYARIDVVADPAASGGRRYRLLRGADPARDQSYFLFTATQARLAHLWFPIGSLDKTAVRAHARRFGLAVADKPDSQEICFVPDGDHGRFVREHAAGAPQAGPGDFVDLAGHVVGRHRGIEHYTVGQRRGLALAGPEPRYVVRIDAAANRVVVATPEALGARGLVARRVSWVAGVPPRDGRRVGVKVRHRATASPATVCTSDGGASLRVTFDAPERAVSPGQAAVVYDGDEVLGGGFIDEVET